MHPACIEYSRIVPEKVVAMTTEAETTEVKEFLEVMLPGQLAAERAIHDGKVEPRLALWSRQDPVTVLGARRSGSGWAEVEPMFRAVASWFTNARDYRFELVAAGASGDLAYTVGYEHIQVDEDGEPRTYTLRATHVYRREDGEWRIVHRHADVPPAEDTPLVATLSRAANA
jgi:ketosteroid isomerase-like protein